MTVNNEDMEEQEPAMVPAPARITFARKSDLQKVLRRSDKGLEEAFKLLESVIRDESADPKLKVDAAKFLIEKRIAISSEMAKDQLARCVGEARLLMAQQATHQRMLKDAGTGSAYDDNESSSQPVYRPDMILDASNLKEM